MIRSRSALNLTGLFGIDETVRLSIRGPRTLVGREAVETSANISESWYTFFKDKCGFPLDSLRTPILVTSSDYSAKLGRGWMTSDIHRPIMDFMSYFQRRREKYSIRIQFEANSVRNPSLNITSADFELSYQTNNTTPGRKRQRHQSSSAVLTSGGQFNGTGMVPLTSFDNRQPSIIISCGRRSSTENLSLPIKKRRYSGFPSENSMSFESSPFLTPLSNCDGAAGLNFGQQINMSAASSNNSTLYESATSFLENVPQSPRSPIIRVPQENRLRTPTPNALPRVVTPSLETTGNQRPRTLTLTPRAKIIRNSQEKGCRTATPNVSATASASPLHNLSTQQEYRRPTPTPIGRRTRTPTQQHQQKTKTNVEVINLIDSDDEDNNNINNNPNVGHHDDDDDDDMNSQITATEEEKDEMRTDGIQVKTLRHIIKKNFGRIPNSLLLKAQKEMKELKQQKKWTKNMQRTPLCYMLLEEFLK